MEYNTSLMLQMLMSGLLMGGIYALTSIGLTMIYGVMDVVNFAHGSFLMLGMYGAFWIFYIWGLNPYLTIPLVAVIFFGVGWIIQKVFINHVLDAPLVAQFIITFGFMLFIENSALAIWSVDPRVILTEYSYMVYDIGGVVIPFPRLIAFILSLVVSAILYLFLNKTFIGLSLRATSQNKLTARIVGVNTQATYAMTMGIGISLVAVAGALIVLFFPATPFVGIAFLTISFTCIVLGGLGNYAGAFFAGLIIGIIEGVAGFMIAPQFKQVVYLLIFILILLVKPRGLLGEAAGGGAETRW